MTAITAFLHKTPITRLKDYFTAGGFTSLPPIDWAKPEPEVVESLVKAVDARARDSGNTQLSKDFPGGVLVMTGANSAVGLRSMPARYVFLDEVDAYAATASGIGW